MNEQELSMIPQEIVYEIFQYIPEYGFLVNKYLHKLSVRNNYRSANYSFYCDTRRFLLDKFVSETDVDLAYITVDKCFNKFVYGSNWTLVPVFEDIRNFGPWIDAMNVLRSQIIVTIRNIIDTSPWSWHGQVTNEIIGYLGIIYNRTDVRYTTIIDINNDDIVLFWAPIIAWKSGIMTYDEARTAILRSYGSNIQVVVEQLSRVLPRTRNDLYDTLVLMFADHMPLVARRLLQTSVDDDTAIKFMESVGVNNVRAIDIHHMPKCIERLIVLVNEHFKNDSAGWYKKMYEILDDIRVAKN